MNVGAGTGNYEPVGRMVVAVEPAWMMIAQRPPGASSRVVRAAAEALPFRTGAFDASMAVLTLQHWNDVSRGLDEMLRVSGRQVILLYDPTLRPTFWLMRYFPEMNDLPSAGRAPSAAAITARLRNGDVRPVPVPHDCVDAFAGASWARPERLLRPDVALAASALAQLPGHVRARGQEELRRDLESGAWDQANGHLRELNEYDVGFRLIVADDRLRRGAAATGDGAGPTSLGQQLA